MGISASDVKALREKTGAGMMACKEALNQTSGDFEAAVDYLRKKGLAAVQKKQSRTAADGTIVTVINNERGILLEVNCETDFVAKGDDFKGFANSLANYALENSINDVTELKNQQADNINELTLKCGEKLDVRRMVCMNTQGKLGLYNHGGKIGVIVEVDTDLDSSADFEELLKDLSMHVTAASPQFLAANDIDEGFKNREAKIYSEQLKEQGKPENMIPKIVEGKLNKLASEVCFLSQKYVKNPDITVEKHINEVATRLGGSINLKSFQMLILGEGVEKREDNLADEVAKMTGQQ